LSIAPTTDHQPPNGIGPQCSAKGPKAATGKKSSAPMITIVPTKREAKVNVSSLNVPGPNGLDFLAPRNAAITIGAMIGRKRLITITIPLAISHWRAVGAGLGLLLNPYVTPSPSKAEPLFADDEEN
jgi:hypothetical protein